MRDPFPYPFPHPRQLLLTCQLLRYPLPPIPLRVLIDSRASGNFIDPQLLADNNLPTHPHPQPIPVELIDGSPPAAGPITCYFSAELRSPGDHTETISFDVTRQAHCLVVLDFPWLHKHNPTIDWQSGTLSLTSPLCAAM